MPVREADGFVAVARLPGDVTVRLAQHLDEDEAEPRLPLGHAYAVR